MGAPWDDCVFSEFNLRELICCCLTCCHYHLDYFNDVFNNFSRPASFNSSRSL